MAITPRTILSQPINLLLFALSILVLGGLLGVVASVSDSERNQRARYVPPDAPMADEGADTGVSEAGFDEFAGEEYGEEYGERTGSEDVMVAGAEVDNRDYTCRLEDPAPSWSEGQWLRHLGCMEARGEADEVLLDETTAAIDEVGLTPDLAVKKADYLKGLATPDEHIVFLDGAVTRLGVSEGQLVHRLARALTWRGETDDIERIRHLQLLSRMLLPESCEVQQTDIWVRYALADRMAEAPSPAAWHGVRHAIATYVADDCHLRHNQAPIVEGEPDRDPSDQDQLDLLTEMVGVGVVAEATNGHSGQSTLIREVAESYELRGEDDHVRSFCQEAVPAGVGLRSVCEKRLKDEMYLAR